MRFPKTVTAIVLAAAFFALTPIQSFAFDRHEGGRGRGGYAYGRGGYERGGGYYGGGEGGGRGYYEHMRHEQWEQQRAYGYGMYPGYGYYSPGITFGFGWGGGDGDGD